MSDIVSIEQVREHLRLEVTDTSQDQLLAPLIVAARRSLEKRTGKTLAGMTALLPKDDMAVLGQAALLMVGHWYANRESVAVGLSAADVPQTVEWLLEPYRDWVV